MGNISSNAAKRQAEICLALVKKIDRSVVESRRSADQEIAAFYRQHREYGARDRRFFSNAVFSWFRWRGWLKTTDNEKIVAAVLLDAAEISPPLKNMIENSTLSSQKPEPLGSLNLNDKAAALRNLLQCERLEIEQLVPDWFPSFLHNPGAGEDEAHLEQCIRACQTRPPTWLRLPLDREDGALDLLAKTGYEIERHPLLKQAVFVKGQKKFDAAKFPAIEVQDLASQCVGLCCHPEPGEQWWDLCAGSGGKSLHLADLTKDKGVIMATDIRPQILNQFMKRLKKNNYRSIKTSLWDGVNDPAPDKCFDGILVDVPCSGSGTWARNPDARWRIFPEQIRNYALIQANLLEIAAKKIKPGGRLVYSTCSLTTLENADVIKTFLEQHHDFRLEPLFNPLTLVQSDGLIWIWPWEWNSNGMFIAVLRKNCASTALP